MMNPQDLVRTVQGDFDAFAIVREQTPQVIQECRAKLPDLVVTVEALRRVLRALQRSQISPSDVQQWASFIRRGYVAGTCSPVKPIDIDYALSDEDKIVEVVSRLDQLGDVIDGEINDDELTEMIRSLDDDRGRLLHL